MDIGLSDHKLIYCTRKKFKEKLIPKLLSNTDPKKLHPSNTNRKMKNAVFPDYSTFNNVNEGYVDLIEKITSIIDELWP